MTEPKRVDVTDATPLHNMILAEFGGPAGVRDAGLLESALMRPRNRFAYEGVSDIPALAASYAFGIARNHPFIDGNKRTAFMVMAVCVEINGLDFTAPEPEATATILALAAGEVAEEELAVWVAANSAPR